MKTGFVIFAHGSRIESANESVRAAAAGLATAGGFELVEAAFLDLAFPSLTTAVGDLICRGAERIVVIPYFLTLGAHLERDLPRIIEEASRVHDEIQIEATPPLEGHPALGEILLARARAVETESDT
jgi:sirohydrochlorin ferrochelatase